MKRWIHASSTSDKISYLQERIDVLEEKLRGDNYIDPEERIDDQIELEELKEQLNFAWQDDEAEYNYALQQQEFNPDGSLKGYDDIYDSTKVTASSEWAASWDKRQDSGAPYYVMSVPSGTARVIPNDADGSRYHAEIKFRNGENRHSVAFDDELDAMDWAENILFNKTYVKSSSITASEMFPDEISIKLYPDAPSRYQWATYKKDYEHEGGGCYYYCKDTFDPLTSQFVSLYPDGSLTFLWNGVEKPLNKEWKKGATIDASTLVTASTTTLSDSKSDCQWMLGLYWDVDGHDLTITGVNGYPLFSCEVTESWIAEDSGEERESKSWYDIKEDSRGYIYIQNKKHRDYKLYLQSAFNYTEDKVPSEFDELYFIRDGYDSDDDEDIDDEYTPSATRGDYSPSNPWDAPGMSIRDFI